MRFAAVPLLFVSIAALGSCSGEAQPDDTAVPEETAVEPAVEATLLVLDPTVGEGGTPVDSAGVNAIFDPECVITEQGVANLAMPATLGEFVEAFPARTVLTFYPSYMVDFGALCARSDGEDAICAIFENYEIESYAGGIGISAFSVQADQCRTVEGLGPGSPIADAVAAYGPATFGFNYDNEGREYVRFENEPAGYAFRAESATGDTLEGDVVRAPGRHGGDYSGVSGDGGYFETNRAQPDATLWEVWLTLR